MVHLDIDASEGRLYCNTWKKPVSSYTSSVDALPLDSVGAREWIWLQLKRFFRKRNRIKIYCNYLNRYQNSHPLYHR